MDGGYAAVLVFGLAEVGLARAMIWALRRGRRGRRGSAGLAAGAGVAVAGSCAGYLYSTGPGKRSVWAEILSELGLRGDEHVLDVGCGRGAVLILAAHRVPRGKAVGVDIWRARDQNGNSRAATERNADLEGVGDRVEVIDADARELPFPTATFDLVVSS
jgi:SAM-dependent methyltransferase